MPSQLITDAFHVIEDTGDCTGGDACVFCNSPLRHMARRQRENVVVHEPSLFTRWLPPSQDFSEHILQYCEILCNSISGNTSENSLNGPYREKFRIIASTKEEKWKLI